MPSSHLTPGVRIVDRYELERKLGEGGMGSVWRARHLALDSPVAIKFMHVQGGDPERFLARFEREARLAASVRHRNVVSITDYGHMADGTAFMVMDCLDGQPLTDHLLTRPSVAEVLYVAELLTRGLVAVHEAGIVHRDLKPDNIFVVRDATGLYPKLIDFGISKHLRPEGERRSAVTTQDGAIFGTPAYMSPEQARGLREIDERTDIYSMGVILYEALAGRLPYESPYMGDLILAIVIGGAPHLRELRPDLDPRIGDVVMKAMAHDAAQRHQTARELLAALAGLTPGRVDGVRSDRPPIAGHDAGLPSIAFDEPRFSQELSIAQSAVPSVVMEPLRAHDAARRARVRWAVLGVLGALVAGLTLAWAGARKSPSPRQGSAPVVAPERVAQATSIIELTGLPQGAVVELDGKQATARLELPRTDMIHVVRVTAAGHEPWSVEVRATADARIAVTLVPRPSPPEAPPEQAAAAPTPAPGAPASSPPRPSRPARAKSRVITELDY